MKKWGLLFLLVPILVLGSCDRRKITRTDTETSGFAVIAGDESFFPFIEEERMVFIGLHPEAKIEPIYTGEKELFDLLLSDSVRLIVAARELTDAEKQSVEDRKLTVRSQKIARDGIALIIHKDNTDSLINTALLKAIMTGRVTDWSALSRGEKSELGHIRVVFDKSNSSTLRFIRENITNGEALSPDIRALHTNSEVIDYVARTPDALGVIGVNWIRNRSLLTKQADGSRISPNDTVVGKQPVETDDLAQLNFDDAIRVMSVGVSEDWSEDNTFKPYPVFLNNGSYPLTRDVFVILTDLRETLPAGFVKFMAGDAGQRIILKAGLVPATRPTREIYLKDDF